MIYLFYWENFFRQKLVNTWKESFEKKFSDLNIIHVKNIADYDINFYNQNLLSTGFFATKSLFIIDDFPINIWEEEKAGFAGIWVWLLYGQL